MESHFAGSKPWRTDLEPEDLDGSVAAIRGDLRLVKCSKFSLFDW